MNEFVGQKDKNVLKKEIRKASGQSSLGLFIFFVVMQLIGAAVAVILVPTLKKYGEDATFVNLWAPLFDLGLYTVIYLVVCPLGVYFINKLSHRKAKDYLAKPKVSGGFTFKWTLIAIAAAQVVNIAMNIITAILTLLGVELHQIIPGTVPSVMGFVTTSISFLIYAPIMEELLFRGAILHNSKKYGEAFAIVMTSLFFGLYHANYLQSFYTFALALVLGYITVKAESIIPAIIAHFSFNLIGTLATIFSSLLPAEAMTAAEMSMEEQMKLIAENPVPYFGMSFMGFLIMGVVTAGIVLFIVELVKNKKSGALKLNNPCPELKAGEKFFAYISSPMTTILLVVLIAVTVINAIGIGK